MPTRGVGRALADVGSLPFGRDRCGGSVAQSGAFGTDTSLKRNGLGTPVSTLDSPTVQRVQRDHRCAGADVFPTRGRIEMHASRQEGRLPVLWQVPGVLPYDSCVVCLRVLMGVPAHFVPGLLHTLCFGGDLVATIRDIGLE